MAQEHVTTPPVGGTFDSVVESDYPEIIQALELTDPQLLDVLVVHFEGEGTDGEPEVQDECMVPLTGMTSYLLTAASRMNGRARQIQEELNPLTPGSHDFDAGVGKVHGLQAASAALLLIAQTLVESSQEADENE